MLIPTGIGCSIGGHAGDANPVARLLASVCDRLILHPNVVNASDLNEMTDNSWYVEGSILDRFLEGDFYLYKPYSNKILVVCNDDKLPATVNSVNASMRTLGTDIEIVQLKRPLEMQGFIENDKAVGHIVGINQLIEQIKQYDFDALAIHTKVWVDEEISLRYLNYGGINPYGGVEAMVSRYIANKINKPVAHAPVEELETPFNGISHSRMASSTISSCYLNSVLKGLHKAPRITEYPMRDSISVVDIDCLVTPAGCVGEPHISCLDRDIPVIAVEDNRPVSSLIMPEEFIRVSNYIEAVGLIVSMREGINSRMLMSDTKINI